MKLDELILYLSNGCTCTVKIDEQDYDDFCEKWEQYKGSMNSTEEYNFYNSVFMLKDIIGYVWKEE